jgi:predicted Zn-dependent protease
MKRLLLLLLLATFFFSSCDENGDLVIFPVENDLALGLQVSEQISSMPDSFPVLQRASNAQAYAYLQNMVDSILSSPAVNYADRFAYDSIKIIHDDEVLNAFATPGGYIYVYTGLIKYLDTKDQLAGVLGHEIAHSELRHSSKALQRQLGGQLLLDIILGDNQNAVTQVLTGLGTLRFGRKAEEEADAFSVTYLSSTPYACDGAAAFFAKIDAEGSMRTPAFLSTHPNPGNRVADIAAKAGELNCNTTEGSKTDYNSFKAMLP